MVSKDDRKGSKLKPRGRPFPKGNVKGKDRGNDMDSAGHQISVDRGVVAPTKKQEIVEPLKHEINDYKLDDQLMDGKEDQGQDEKELSTHEGYEEVDSIKFSDEKGNVLKIVLNKKKINRAYRMQIFINGDQEVRPMTYNGTAAALSFWKLLKGCLKK